MSSSEYNLPDGLFEASTILSDPDHAKLDSLRQALDAFTVSTFLEAYLAYRMHDTPVVSAASLQSQATGALIRLLKTSSDIDDELRIVADANRGLNEGSYRTLLLDPRLPYSMLRKLLWKRSCEAFGPALYFPKIKETVDKSQKYMVAHKKQFEFELIDSEAFAALAGLQHIAKVKFANQLKTTLPDSFKNFDWSNVLLVTSLYWNAGFMYMSNRESTSQRVGPHVGQILLFLHGLTFEEAMQKLNEIVSSLGSPQRTPCYRDSDRIYISVHNHGHAINIHVILKLHSTPAEILLGLSETCQIGFDGVDVLMTPKLALLMTQREIDVETHFGGEEAFSNSENTESEDESGPIGSINDTQFECLKLAISDRLGNGYQPFGYRNYLTRRIRCVVEFHSVEEMWDKQLTTPLCVPWDLETRVIPKILERTDFQLEDMLIPVHDPTKLDPTTAILPPMYDTKNERGNLRYLLLKEEFAFKRQHRVIDELYAVLGNLHKWWIASGWNGNEEVRDFQYRTDVKECVYYLAERCIRRDDDYL